MAIRDLSPEDVKYQWIDVLNPTQEEVKKISEEYGIHMYLLMDCLDPEHLPKFEEIGDLKFIISRENLLEDTDKIFSIKDFSTKLAMFVKDDLLITIHRMENKSINQLAKKLDENHKYKKSPYDIVVSLAWQVLHSFDEEGIRLDEKIEYIETEIFLKNTQIDLLKDMYLLKRKIDMILRILNHSREWVGALRQMPADKVIQQDVRDLYVKLLSVYENMNTDIANLLNIHLSISAQKNNEVMKVLAVISLYFLPVTFMAGVWGMNFKFMPELDQPYGYYLALLSMALVALGTFIYLKYKKLK